MSPALLLLALLSLGPAARSDDLSSRLLSSLQKATSFLESAHLDCILDGFVGYRFLDARIKEVLKNCSTNPSMSLRCEALDTIQRTISNLTDQSMDSLKQKDAEYFSGFWQVIAGNFWKTPTSWDVTNSTLAYSSMNNTDCYAIDTLDPCMRYILIGSSKNNLTACSVPPLCRKFMTQPGCSGYVLSHQLFYSMIASTKGCRDPLFVEEISHYKKIFCANMMKINQKTEELNFPFVLQDMFAENIMFCGMVGFLDFLKPEWLRVMLSWQDPHTGCFGTIKDETAPTASDMELALIVGGPDFLDSISQLTGPLKGNTDKRQRSGSHRRVKRNELELEGGCLCHMTTVVVGALAQYLVNC